MQLLYNSLLKSISILFLFEINLPTVTGTVETTSWKHFTIISMHLIQHNQINVHRVNPISKDINDQLWNLYQMVRQKRNNLVKNFLREGPGRSNSLKRLFRKFYLISIIMYQNIALLLNYYHALHSFKNLGISFWFVYLPH